MTYVGGDSQMCRKMLSEGIDCTDQLVYELRKNLHIPKASQRKIGGTK